MSSEAVGRLEAGAFAVKDAARGAVTGVELESGESIRCEAVVSNMDAVRTYTQLLGGKIEKILQKGSMSLPDILAALKRKLLAEAA